MSNDHIYNGLVCLGAQQFKEQLKRGYTPIGHVFYEALKDDLAHLMCHPEFGVGFVKTNDGSVYTVVNHMSIPHLQFSIMIVDGIVQVRTGNKLDFTYFHKRFITNGKI